MPVSPVSELVRSPRALATRAAARPRRAAGALLVLGLVLAAVGVLADGSWAAAAVTLAFLTLATAYGLELNRTWQAAGRGSR